MGLLDGKRAVVTGGGGGIGRGVCERFAAEGADVVVVDVDSERAHDAAGAIGGSAVVADVTTADGAAAAVGDGCDVLVNNVGHYGSPGRTPFHEQAEGEWELLYRVNLAHVFLCTRAAVPHMVADNGGAIVNVSTVEAFRGIPGRAVYSAFKAAITGFTRSLALEYAKDGVRVNAVAPDVTETLQVPYSQWVGPDDQARIPTWVPIGRFGTPHDIAGAVLFLASDLSAFVTGTTVHADGGTFAAGGWYKLPDGTWTNRPRL